MYQGKNKLLYWVSAFTKFDEEPKLVQGDSIVKKVAVKAGIKKQISFHTLRHCFATHLLEKGVNLKLIQQFMGHASIKTTSGYLHLANVNPASVISPLDSMNL